MHWLEDIIYHSILHSCNLITVMGKWLWQEIFCGHRVINSACRCIYCAPEDTECTNQVKLCASAKSVKSLRWRARALTLKSQVEHEQFYHQMDGWLSCARLCAHPQIFAVKICADSTNVLWRRGDYKLKSPMCIHTQKYHIHVKDPVVHVRVWQIM